MIDALVQLANALGFWATLVLFVVLLVFLIFMAKTQVERDAAAAKARNTDAIARAYERIAELRSKLNDAEYEIAKEAILTEYGITETRGGVDIQRATPDQQSVRVASILGAITPPGCYLLLALLSGGIPAEFSKIGTFVVAVVFLGPPVYGGVKAISNKISTPKNAFWQGFFYSTAILLAEMMLLVMVASLAQPPPSRIW